MESKKNVFYNNHMILPIITYKKESMDCVFVIHVNDAIIGFSDNEDDAKTRITVFAKSLCSNQYVEKQISPSEIQIIRSGYIKNKILYKIYYQKIIKL